MNRRADNGFALVSVLWIVMILSIIALSVIAVAQSARKSASLAVQRAKAEALADAGIYRAIAGLLTLQTKDRWPADGTKVTWRFHERSANVTIEPEAAKIDLNYANHELLRGLFLAVGTSPEKADALADAIEDWRDEDDLKRLNGAERREYAAVGRPDAPANAMYQTIDDVRSVLGMSDQIFNCIKSDITVYSARPDIDANAASPLVKRAAGLATNISSNGAGRQRSATVFGSLAGEAFRIRVSAEDGLFVREAVVRITEDPTHPYWVLLWRNGTGAGTESDSNCRMK